MNTLPLNADPKLVRLLKMKRRARLAQLVPGASPAQNEAAPMGWWVLDAE